MNRAAGIRKHGFRRWYERQLIESHAYLVTCFLCMVLIAACAEMFSLRGPGLEQLELLTLLAAGLFVCVASWHRYHVLMVRAELTGEQSTCENCRTYGRFSVLKPPAAAGSPAHAAAQIDSALTVHCKVCGHEWLIE